MRYFTRLVTLLLLQSSFIQSAQDTGTKAYTKGLAYLSQRDTVRRIEPLLGGHSGARMYTVIGTEKSYVMRVIADKSFDDAEREITAHTYAAAAGVAPALQYANAKNRLIIMDYISPQPVSVLAPVQMNILAATLKKLHSYQPAHNLLLQGSYADRMIGDIDKVNYYPSDFSAQDAQALLLRIKQKLQVIGNVKRSLTHGDVHRNNIIWATDRCYFIDYEDMSIDDPFFDLATVAIHFFHNADAERSFVAAYLGHEPTSTEKLHFCLMKRAALLCYGLRALQKMKCAHSLRVADAQDFNTLAQAIIAGEQSLASDGDYAALGVSMLRAARTEEDCVF